MKAIFHYLCDNNMNPLQSASRGHKATLKLVLITNLVQQKQMCVSNN